MDENYRPEKLYTPGEIVKALEISGITRTIEQVEKVADNLGIFSQRHEPRGELSLKLDAVAEGNLPRLVNSLGVYRSLDIFIYVLRNNVRRAS